MTDARQCADKLPEGWATCALRELLASAIGGEWGLPPEKADGKSLIAAAVIRGTEFRAWDREKGATAARRAIPAKKLESRQLQEGDLVLEVSGGGPQQPVGRTILIDRETLNGSSLPLTCSNFCRRLQLSRGLSPPFVWWGLRALYARGEFDQYQTQTTNLRNLNVTDFLNGLNMPVAPLAEQRRIVAKVEELLARVNAARERLRKVPLILKRFRQSILAAACSGQLTADWRGDDSSNGDTPSGWRPARVSDVCSHIVDCPHSTPKWTVKGELCLRTTNFQPGRLDLSVVRTHVAGIIAGQGIAMPEGVAPRCKILPIRVLGAMKFGQERRGAGLEDNINSGLKLAIDRKADVVNMSLGMQRIGGGLPHEDIVKYARLKGVTIVAASGNDGQENLYYPGALPGVITVGAFDDRGEVAAFSTYGQQVSFIAPGTDVYSSYLDDDYAFSSGTSHAAPFVAGGVLLLKSYARSRGRKLSDQQVKHVLKHTADKVGRGFRHPKAGFGRLNLGDALRLLEYRLN